MQVADELKRVSKKAIVPALPSKDNVQSLHGIDAFIRLLDNVISFDVLKDSRTGFLNDLSRANRYADAFS